MDFADDEEFQSTQGLSQEDRITDTVDSVAVGVWGILLSDGLTLHVDLCAPKAILGRCLLLRETFNTSGWVLPRQVESE